MRRVSYYVSAKAADALDDAVDRVMDTLGRDFPKHAILSALIAAGTTQVAQVAAELAERRAAELTERLDALRNRDD